MAYAFNQVTSRQWADTPIDRRVGDAKSYIEVDDNDVLMIFKAIGLGDERVGLLAEMQPFDQRVIDLAIEALAVAVVGDNMLQQLIDVVAEGDVAPFPQRNIRHTLNKATLDRARDRVDEIIHARKSGTRIFRGKSGENRGKSGTGKSGTRIFRRTLPVGWCLGVSEADQLWTFLDSVRNSQPKPLISECRNCSSEFRAGQHPASAGKVWIAGVALFVRWDAL